VRFVVVSQYYWPEPVRIPGEIAAGLAERGHEVVVVTGYPNYPEGRLAAGYRIGAQPLEQVDGIPVHRVPIQVSHSRNPIGRIRNYLSYGRAVARRQDLARGADAVYVYATQMTAAMGPAHWRRRGGPPYVLHIQDLWPDSITASSLVPAPVGRAIARALGGWLRRMYRDAARVIAIAPAMADLLVARGVPSAKVQVVFNWAVDADDVALVPRDDRPDGLRLIYAGNIGDVQDLDTVLDALALLGDGLQVELDVFGTGVAEPRIRRRAAELGLSRVHFRGVVPRDQIGRHYAEADFQLITLKSHPVFEVTIPSKFPAGLAHGLPVLTNVSGEVARLVDGARIGVTCRPGDPEDLARALRIAHAIPRQERIEMGRRAREMYEQRMSREEGLTAIERALVDAAQGERS
jgi:colanic acid biosynthesis glycosyl transferase WcaI